MMTTTNRSKGSGDGVGSKKALADAFAGVMASLISTMAFYPVDVWKTSMQADGVVNHNKDETDEGRSSVSGGQQSTTATTTVHRLQFLLTKSFRGLPHKLLHTMGSSFTYFFVYSLVQTKYTAYVKRRHHIASSSSFGCCFGGIEIVFAAAFLVAATTTATAGRGAAAPNSDCSTTSSNNSCSCTNNNTIQP